MSRAQYFIHKVGRGKEGAQPLTFEEALEAGRMLLGGRFTPVQEGAFLAAMRVKSEEPQEIAGLTQALRETGLKLRVPFEPLEVPSYAGKKDALSILPAAALIACAAGVPILVHGRKEEPERLGSEEVFEELGVPTQLSIDELRPRFERSRFGFLNVERFHPALAKFLRYKLEMGVRSFFFVISRLSNPTGSRKLLVPITHKPYFEKYRDGLKLIGVDRAIVFFSSEGEAELPYHGALTAVEVAGAGARDLNLKPEERIKFDDTLKIRDARGTAEATLAILRNEPSSARTLALRTAALYVYAYGAAPDFASAVKLAEEAVASGKALETHFRSSNR